MAAFRSGRTGRGQRSDCFGLKGILQHGYLCDDRCITLVKVFGPEVEKAGDGVVTDRIAFIR